MRLPGAFLLRFADRQLTALLFHPPPRLTRFEPVSAVTQGFDKHESLPNGSEDNPFGIQRQAEKNRRLALSVLARRRCPVMLDTDRASVCSSISPVI